MSDDRNEQIDFLQPETIKALCKRALADYDEAIAELTRLRERNAELLNACAKADDEVCQTLAKALGYPWFKDDQKNFPGATEDSGVCVGDHVAGSIAAEAVARIASLEASVREMRGKIEGLKNHAKADRVFFAKEYGPACMGVVYADNKIRLCDEALASSESVVKSEGENDGVV